MSYTIDLKPLALRQLADLNKNIRERLNLKIQALAENPRPYGVKKLTGYEQTYRIRVGDYRVLYEIHDQILLILVVEVGHRGSIYRKK